MSDVQIPADQFRDVLPCPFCGSSDIDPNGWKNDTDETGPQCMGCGATSSSEHWNRRDTQAILDAAPGIVECLPLEQSLTIANWLRQAADFWRGVE